VIGALPLGRDGGALEWLDYRSGRSAAFGAADLALFAGRVVSEALLIDWRNEGRAGGFDLELVRRFPLGEVPLIAFGGISEPAQLDALLGHERVAAAGIGNFLAYREHAVQKLRQQVTVAAMRPPVFGGG
jgi:cyclase